MVTIGFSQAGLSVNEADGPLSLMIVKEGDSEIDIEIEIQLEDASATGMFDFNNDIVIYISTNCE